MSKVAVLNSICIMNFDAKIILSLSFSKISRILSLNFSCNCSYKKMYGHDDSRGSLKIKSLGSGSFIEENNCFVKLSPDTNLVANLFSTIESNFSSSN